MILHPIVLAFYRKNCQTLDDKDSEEDGVTYAPTNINDDKDDKKDNPVPNVYENIDTDKDFQTSLSPNNEGTPQDNSASTGVYPTPDINMLVADQAPQKPNSTKKY